MQFLQCLNKMRIKQSAAGCCAPKSSPCHQMIFGHHCTVPPSPFCLVSLGVTRARDVTKFLSRKYLEDVGRLCFVFVPLSLPRLSSASRGSPRDLGAREGSAPAAPHTARLRNAAEYFYGADLDNSVDSPLAFSFSLMFQTTHGVPTLH